MFHRGGHLYEHLPDLFPFGFVSDLECAVLSLCYEWLESARKTK